MHRASLREKTRFGALLASEARKLRTVPSARLMFLVLVGVTCLAVVVPIVSGDLDPRMGDADTIIVGVRQSDQDRIREILGAEGVAGIIAMVLAAVAVAGDTRFGTIVHTLLAEPRRSRLAGAQIVLHLFVGLILGCIAAAIIALSAPALMSARHVPLGLSHGQLATILLGVIVHTALYAGLGAALGLLIPSQPAAVAVTLFGLGLAEPLVSAALGSLRVLSFSGASDSLLGIGGGAPAIVGAAVLGGWLLVVGTGSAVALNYRDLR